jgi:protein phosphatase
MTANKKSLSYTFGRMTVVGKRENQEDNYCLMPLQAIDTQIPIDAIFAVADGVGGHAAGEVASRKAIDTLQEFFGKGASQRALLPGTLQGAPLKQTIVSVIKEINRRIYQAGGDMGTTLTAGFLQGNNLIIGHVGDSRAYLIRGKSIKQLTKDHSWVAEKVNAGIITEEQAKRDPQRSAILRSLGQEASVDVDIEQVIIEPGDILIFCSDGLTDRVDDFEIRDIAISHDDPQEACQKMVNLAQQKKEPRQPEEPMDNTTALVVKFSGSPPQSANKLETVKLSAAEIPRKKLSTFLLILIALLAFFGASAVVIVLLKIFNIL